MSGFFCNSPRLQLLERQMRQPPGYRPRGHDRPRREEYVRVYEGEIENYSLEEVWEKYGRRVPEGFQGHALSISDVIEFADGENSRFFYIEPSGYEEIRF